jgi:hypothetical protein
VPAITFSRKVDATGSIRLMMGSGRCTSRIALPVFRLMNV